MEHLLFAIGAGTIVLLATRACYLFLRWNRRRRLRGALDCLDAVHNTLTGLAECKVTSCQEDRTHPGSQTQPLATSHQPPATMTNLSGFVIDIRRCCPPVAPFAGSSRSRLRPRSK